MVSMGLEEDGCIRTVLSAHSSLFDKNGKSIYTIGHVLSCLSSNIPAGDIPM